MNNSVRVLSVFFLLLSCLAKDRRVIGGLLFLCANALKLKRRCVKEKAAKTDDLIARSICLAKPMDLYMVSCEKKMK